MGLSRTAVGIPDTTRLAIVTASARESGMTSAAESTVQQDVYSNEPRTHTSTSDHLAAQLTAHVAVENSPLSLGRVFGLVGTVSIVPESSSTVLRADNVVEVQLTFSGEEPRKIDLLCRKLNQLTETISVRVDAAISEPTNS